jgi:hypothetical protein
MAYKKQGQCGKATSHEGKRNPFSIRLPASIQRRDAQRLEKGPEEFADTQEDPGDRDWAPASQRRGINYSSRRDRAEAALKTGAYGRRLEGVFATFALCLHNIHRIHIDHDRARGNP